jgi:Cof subfamily protein (haloacid dehalogenase superfamily)
MTYQLMALDMDGTLLTSDKKIDEITLQTMKKAVDAGKHIVICSGRPEAELKPYQQQLADAGVRYHILESGALVYDAEEKKILHRHNLPPECVPVILDAAEREDIMCQIIVDSTSNVDGSKIAMMDHYQMGIYQPLYEICATAHADVLAYGRQCLASHLGMEKFNLYHTSRESRKRTRQYIHDTLMEKFGQVALRMVDAEISSLEISAVEGDKGTGLLELCQSLGLDPANTIAVGDADNDLTMLAAAGLPVAMANGNEHVNTFVKEHHGAITADNDHHGCADAIVRYLL